MRERTQVPRCGTFCGKLGFLLSHNRPVYRSCVVSTSGMCAFCAIYNVHLVCVLFILTCISPTTEKMWKAGKQWKIAVGKNLSTA